MNKNNIEIPITRGITRRDFLERTAGAAIMVTAGIATAVRGGAFVAEGVIPSPAFTEGSLLQRLVTFQELILLSPTDENKDLLVAWLKLNAAEYYFVVKKCPLVSQMIQHFLYGKGGKVDISTPFQIAAIETQKQIEEERPSTKKAYEEYHSNNGDPLVRFFETQINLNSCDWTHQVGNRILVPNGNALKQLERGYIPPDNFLKIRIYPGYTYPYGEDIFYSLGQYTLVASGKINGNPVLPRGEYENRLTVRLKPVKVSITDHYDWIRDDVPKENLKGVVAPAKMSEFLIPFLKGIGVNEPVGKIKDLIGPERARQLMETMVTFSAQEGDLLVKRNYGYPFDITGTFNLPEIELKIPFVLFEQSLE